jgi:hypothetical protein
MPALHKDRFRIQQAPAETRCRIAAMKRRCCLAVTLVTLAMHLLAPVGAYAAARPAADSSDYCSAARSDVQSVDGIHAPQRGAMPDSGAPAPRSSHSPHSHCPSCVGAFVAAAIPPSATPFVVRPRSLHRVPSAPARTDIAAQPALLPPLRGPPPALL